ncbi:hypothetical protein SY88_07015 [Clostridiales bacterium PH28_bin88]|nr:hypothetical protein SY88_07015 [Clostridiales bacterium PH28_bin88]
MAAGKKAKPGREALNFEEALARLETVVRTLESGELSLEDALQQFELGIGLTRICNEHLNKAENRIRVLMDTEDGRLVTEPFKWNQESGGKD